MTAKILMLCTCFNIINIIIIINHFVCMCVKELLEAACAHVSKHKNLALFKEHFHFYDITLVSAQQLVLL